MSEAPGPSPGLDPSGLGPEVRQSFVERYALAQRAEGVLAPILTTLLAFFVGGLVVLVTTGKNPITTYKAIFEGAGWSWFFEVGNHEVGLPFGDAKVWFPWNVSDAESFAAANLQQTLIITSSLILTGLAVAFAFRCGMFNIGGQGQYIVGSIFAVWIGSSFSGMSPFLHILLAMVVGTLAGAVWAGIAGFLKATVGAHEVISTIMLNWIAIWVGSFLFGLGGPLQSDTQTSVPISNDVVEDAILSVFWGDPLLQGLPSASSSRSRPSSSTGCILNRTTLGYGCARSGSTPMPPATAASASRATTSSRWRSPARSRVSAARSTSSAGSSASRDRYPDLRDRVHRDRGRAPRAKQGDRHVLRRAPLRHAPDGTSTRNLDPEIFPPELAVEPDPA